MARTGSPAPPRKTQWGPPRPDSPRRRSWMLVAITLVALVPAAIGFGFAELAGGKKAPSATARPPTALLTTAQGQVKAELGTYQWKYHDNPMAADAATDAPSNEPVLSVAPGETVGVAFRISAVPGSVSLRPAAPGSAGRSLHAGNPTDFKVTSAPGRHPVVISTRWAQGSASYLVLLQVG